MPGINAVHMVTRFIPLHVQLKRCQVAELGKVSTQDPGEPWQVKRDGTLLFLLIK